jgi:hypothetical protein
MRLTVAHRATGRGHGGCILLEPPSPDGGRLSGSVRIPASDTGIRDRQCHRSRVSLHRDRVQACHCLGPGGPGPPLPVCGTSSESLKFAGGPGAATAVTARADPPLAGTPAAPAGGGPISGLGRPGRPLTRSPWAARPPNRSRWQNLKLEPQRLLTGSRTESAKVPRRVTLEPAGGGHRGRGAKRGKEGRGAFITLNASPSR